MNSQQPQASDRKEHPRLVIVVLLLIFSAPLLSSWFILNYTDMVKSGSASHGDLYDPLVNLPDVVLTDPVTDGGNHPSLHGKWSLLYISTGRCGEACVHKLYSMRQIRLAVSRYARNLQRVWVTDIRDPQAWKNVLDDFEGTLVLPMDAGDPPLPLEEFDMPPLVDVLQGNSLYVVDPGGRLVLRYRPGTDPEGIISDLKRLLKTSEIS